MGDTDSNKLRFEPRRSCGTCGQDSPFSFPAGQGEHQHDWEPPRVVDGKLNPDWVMCLMGVPRGWFDGVKLSRQQKLKMLGNAVIPQIPYAIGRAINQLDEILYGD